MPNPPSQNYTQDADKHRFVFKGLRIEHADKAKPGELVIDTAKGIFYVKGDDGKLHSQSADVSAKLKELEDSGILQSALAYVNNAEVYTIYKKENKIKLDVALKMSIDARYYAVRGTDPKTGKMVYMTGLLNNGVVENSLIDITHDGTLPPGSAYTGTATVGVLHTPSLVMEGRVYYLELYDSERVLISSVPAQVIEVSSLNFALAPQYNCTKILITTSQDMTDNGEEITYVYRGQSLSSLEIWVTGVFANGDKKLLNSDLASSRLIIKTPPNADTNTVGNTFEIDVKYYIEDVKIQGATQQEMLTWASLSAKRKVKVIEDVYTNVKALIPVPFVKKEKKDQTNQYSDQIDLRVFSLYVDNKLEDVTKNTRLTISSEFDPNTFDTVQKFKLAIGLGASSTQFEESVTLLMGSSPHYQIRRLTLEHADWNMNATKPLLKTPVAQVDTKNNKFKNWMRLNANDSGSTVDTYTANATQKGSVQALIALGTRKIDNNVTEPTHIRVRSVIKSEFLHTPTPIPIRQACDGFEFVDTSSGHTLDNYQTSNGGIPYPVLVEFLRLNDSTKLYERIAIVPFFTTATTDFVM